MKSDDGGDLKRSGHDRRVRSLAARLGCKSQHQIPVELGGIGRREPVGDNDVRQIVRSCIPRSLAKKVADDAAGYVLDVHNPLAQVGVVNFRKRAAIFVGDLAEDVFHVAAFAVEAAEHFVD